MKMKKTIILLITLLLGTASIFAESGTTGSLSWTLDNDTLTITGTDIMPDYSWAGNYAPWYSRASSIKTVVIGNGVKSIGDVAFYNCNNLTSVTVPASVTSIGFGAFYDCNSLVSVIIPEDVKRIGDAAFYKCCSLTSIIIPGGVTNIERSTFVSCSNLTSVTIMENVKSIDDGAFASCIGLTSVIIPNSLSSIGNSVFYNCSSLASITIPDRVISIKYWTFYNCSNLASVTIPESVTSIGGSAFLGCSSLLSVTNLNPVPQDISEDVFSNVDLSKVTLYVPAGSVERYTATGVWKDFKPITAYVSSAIESSEAESGVSLYPNPIAESFRIEGLNVPTQVTVMDANGNPLLKQTVKDRENILAGHLPPGVYLVRVNEKTVKVIKQ
jgi:hypothetical protein